MGTKTELINGIGDAPLFLERPGKVYVLIDESRLYPNPDFYWAPTRKGMPHGKWSATSGTVADPTSASTTFTMPSGAATVTATFKNAPKGIFGTNSKWYGACGTTFCFSSALDSFGCGDLIRVIHNTKLGNERPPAPQGLRSEATAQPKDFSCNQSGLAV